MAGRKPVTLTSALAEALVAVPTRPEDAAAVQLARSYAAQIDADSEALVKLGPLLLAVLSELGMTPRARAAVVGKGGPGDGAGRSKLDELRERRAARLDAAAPVD